MEPRHDQTFSRRTAVSLLGLGVAGFLAGCSNSENDTATSPGPSSAGATPDATAGTDAGVASTTGGGDAAASATPAETGGPFPADGSNDNGDGEVADVLGDLRAVRRDIRSDLDGTNTQDGAPFDLTMTVVDAKGAAVAGAAVYIWHCNKSGEYSAYNSSMLGGDFSDRSFLRGVQIADANGQVQFSTILPGRYPGRAFHIHFDVFADGTYGTTLLTSQMAIDDDLIDQLYSDADGYASALAADTDNAGDGVFADGVDHQLLIVSGDVATGLTATFTAVV